MKYAGIVVSLAVLLPLAGCGSSATPTLAVSCLSHRLPSGAMRARVTVSNVTSSPVRGFIYGPALHWLTHIHPVLQQTDVVVVVAGNRTTYIAYRLPRLAPKKAAHLLLRFSPSPYPHPLLATDRQSIRAASLAFIKNPKCRIT